MINTLQVRVIKSNERERLEQEDAETENRKKPAHEAVREMKETVCRWVKESQQRRQEEARALREHFVGQFAASGASK
jgi:hypothetical protein